ncbi:hypothetical protein [Sphingomonas sp. CLY1604]|uniref:hypothetical protein n=1 Tax=Sphingomonas sp. CLY1604 TaxID=3457786 RepID=UPI003FD6E067
MGNVWDRTVEVLNGRGGMLAGVAILTLFIPPALASAFGAYVAPGMARSAGALLLALATTLVALWGQLWIIAASIDPATDREAARRQANARLLPALLVALVLGFALIVAMLPAVALMAVSGVNVAAMSAGTAPTVTVTGSTLLASLYVIVLLVAILFVGARMLPLYAVVLRERLGLAAIKRSWQLSRRHTWRIVGVVLLFMVVLLFATTAAQFAVGLILRLILGADARATVAFLATLAGQAASTALTLVAIVFSAQLYLSLVAREQLLRDRAGQAAA